MKHKKVEFSLLLLALPIIAITFICTGCDEGDIFELEIDDKNPEIVHEVNGIKLTFCLLNEQGDSATTFYEGENFVFRFKILNQTDDSLPFNDYGFYTTSQFFSIKSKRKNFGKPFKFIRISTSKQLRYIFSNSFSAFIVPWHDDREEFKIMHGYFRGLGQSFLEKGKYHTEFTYNFTFGSIETGKLTFKINFEIK